MCLCKTGVGDHRGVLSTSGIEEVTFSYKWGRETFFMRKSPYIIDKNSRGLLIRGKGNAFVEYNVWKVILHMWFLRGVLICH